MKKLKTKKPRASRRSRAEKRKGGPGRATPVGTIEHRLSVEEVQEDREGVYIRFGAPPEGGISRRWMFERDEVGMSVFQGYKRPQSKGGGYAVDIPADEWFLRMYRQSTSLIDLILDCRPIFVVEGCEEVGRGGDGEPVIAGGTVKRISPFTRVDLSQWWGEAGRAFARRWKQARRSLGFSASEGARLAALEALLKPSVRLKSAIFEELEELAEDRVAGCLPRGPA